MEEDKHVEAQGKVQARAQAQETVQKEAVRRLMPTVRWSAVE